MQVGRRLRAGRRVPLDGVVHPARAHGVVAEVCRRTARHLLQASAVRGVPVRRRGGRGRHRREAILDVVRVRRRGRSGDARLLIATLVVCVRRRRSTGDDSLQELVFLPICVGGDDEGSAYLDLPRREPIAFRVVCVADRPAVRIALVQEPVQVVVSVIRPRAVGLRHAQPVARLVVRVRERLEDAPAPVRPDVRHAARLVVLRRRDGGVRIGLRRAAAIVVVPERPRRTVGVVLVGLPAGGVVEVRRVGGVRVRDTRAAGIRIVPIPERLRE